MFHLLLQFHKSRPGPPLILRRRFETRDVWMAGQQIRDRAAERAGAVTVDYAQFSKAVQESFVEKLVDQFDSFIGLLTD